jgi:hypothetical protein
LSVLLPETWTGEEVLQIRSPDGSISLNVAGGPTTNSLDGLVDEFTEDLSQLSGYTEMSLEKTIVMAGRPGILRTFRWNTDEDGGEDVVQLQSYVVENGTAYVATASILADAYAGREDMLLALIETVDTTSQPFQVAASEGGEGAEAVADFLAGISNVDLGVDDVSPPDWEGIIPRTWDTQSGATEHSSIVLSTDELQALAQLHGFSGFPGVGASSYDHFSTETRMVAGRTARRSLMAHGIVEVGEADGITVTSPAKDILRIALSPLMVVTGERQDPERIAGTMFFVRREGLVEHSQLSDGSHRLASYESSALVALLVSLLELEGPSHRPDAEYESSVADIAGAMGSKSPVLGDEVVRAVDSVTISYQRGEEMVGGWLIWCRSEADRLWRLDAIEEEDPESKIRVRAVPTTTDEIVSDLIGYLPRGTQGDS